MDTFADRRKRILITIRVGECACRPTTLLQYLEVDSLKSIALCKLKKDQIRELLPQLAADLPQAKFICRKCARVAKHKKMLCKPLVIDTIYPKFEDDTATQEGECSN